MTNSFWQTIAATPWWVYLFSAYLLRLSIVATQPRSIPVKTLANALSLFVALSVFMLIALYQNITLAHLSVWVGTLFLGTGLGYLQFDRAKVKAMKETASIHLPGTWLILVLLILFVLSKWYFDFPLHVTPQYLLSPAYTLWCLFLYGLLTGIFVGRFIYAWYCLKNNQ